MSSDLAFQNRFKDYAGGFLKYFGGLDERRLVGQDQWFNLEGANECVELSKQLFEQLKRREPTVKIPRITAVDYYKSGHYADSFETVAMVNV
jgi:hypothetical protein